MDWKYILSMAQDAEDLEESKKDELLNTIAWYDFSNEKIDVKKSTALIRLCQEIMKHKSEQVEALLAELDEVAIRQAENEVKTQESDEKSNRSKKSVDSDEQDMKYRELRTKYRKLQRYIDSNKEETEKLRQSVKMLEQERVYLQKELRNAHHRDDSASDISESVKDQHRNLMESVQQKNTQISQLLTDIENVESDNLQMRAKLSSLRDELSDATEKIETLMDDNKLLTIRLEEVQEDSEKSKLENLSLKGQVQDFIEDKETREMEFEQFAKEIDLRIEDWKRVLDAKNGEIDQLKSKTNQTSSPVQAANSSSSSFIVEDDTQLNVLHKALAEREQNIIRLQQQLETATKDILKATQVLKQATKERDNFSKKCEKLNNMIKEVRKQLKAAHQRAQELAEDVQYQTRLVSEKDNDIEEILEKINDVNMKKVLKELEQIKAEKRGKEKKVSDLVKSCNKLRTTAENFETENNALKERLGLGEDDFISKKCINVQEIRQKKQMELLRQKYETSEEEKLQYRLELQKFSKIVSNLSDQLLELGETPVVDGQEINVSNLRNHKQDEVDSSKVEYNALLEENDGLRKGLHEILASVQSKQVATSKEIRSETLESLLRALDAKHVSGWYHPAMRLQAEVHTLQGSNITLREQLRIAREELDNYKEKTSTLIAIDNTLDTSNAAAIANLNNHLTNLLKNYHVDDETNVKLIEKLESYKKEFLLVQEQILILYDQYTKEKTKWEEDLSTVTTTLKQCEDHKNSLQAQLDMITLLTDPQTDEELKIKTAADAQSQLVLANRKIVYLENDSLQHKGELTKLREQLLKESHYSIMTVNKLKATNTQISSQLERLHQNAADKFLLPEDFLKLQNDHDTLLIKHREAQRLLEESSIDGHNAIELLTKEVELLQNEKSELAKTMIPVQGDLEKQLAQSVINEATEKQRANHANSLYELVKEQLGKSEQRFQEFQKYNSELMQKNLCLQESVKLLEDKVVHYVDADVYRRVEKECVKLEEEKCALAIERSSLREEINVLRKDLATRSLWTHLDQYELHSLKHQIVDLQATGDDKAVIARLSSDVVVARMTEAEVRKRLDEMVVELTTCRNEHEDKMMAFINEVEGWKVTVGALKRKNSHLENIIKQQRSHYLGYVPYTSQDKLISKISAIASEKRKLQETNSNIQKLEFECELAKETLESKTDILNELNQLIKHGDEQAKTLEKWFLDKTNVQLQELRCRRQAEFKETQLRHATVRLQAHEEQIAQLEAELLQSLCLRDPHEAYKRSTTLRTTTQANVIDIAPADKEDNGNTDMHQSSSNSNMNGALDFVQRSQEMRKTAFCKNTQTSLECGSANEDVEQMRVDLEKKNEEIQSWSDEVQRMKQKVLDLEMSISLLRQQMGDKQSQITFYEKHILEMQQNKKETHSEDHHAINQLQETLNEKERIVFELQTLLKKDRDEHSLAAVRFQDEIKQLQLKLTQQQQDHIAETQQQGKPARAAVEYYIQQVHALEKLTTELQTSVSTLSTQAQSSIEECVRWKSLANDRLQSVDALRIQLEEQHRNELDAYKTECEKWRSEVSSLQQYINSYKKDILDLRPNIEKELKDKDNKIHELLITMRQLKTELRRKTNRNSSPSATQNDDNLEEIKESLLKEQEVLKKRCEQLLSKEKNAREEIRNLKGQLMKRPALSARSDSAATKEQQQQRRIQNLEKEVNELKEKLEREVVLNEGHKARVNADFDKWSKSKHWQQSAEKTKTKLKEKTDECEKLQHTCSSYRMIIERLEREKHNLEVRMKNFKSNLDGGSAGGICLLEENGKLLAEIGTLKMKLEQQQHHSGALSSVILQDKLEAQERKIAILEMSAKGGGELRSELERVQNALSTMQKSNLRLEAENLDLRLDLEKSAGELPHLREQINYLENYIKVLKTDRAEQVQHEVTNGGDHIPNETKRVSELERTVFVLKRLVEKLQVENKRLVGGGHRPCTSSERTTSTEQRVKREFNRVKEQYDEKVATLETELKATKEELNGASSGAEMMKEELTLVKDQLCRKTELLDKVKVLLQRAALKERALLDQVSTLKGMIDAK